MTQTQRLVEAEQRAPAGRLGAASMSRRRVAHRQRARGSASTPLLARPNRPLKPSRLARRGGSARLMRLLTGPLRARLGERLHRGARTPRRGARSCGTCRGWRRPGGSSTASPALRALRTRQRVAASQRGAALAAARRWRRAPPRSAARRGRSAPRRARGAPPARPAARSPGPCRRRRGSRPACAGALSAPRPSSAATVAPTLVPLLSSKDSTSSTMATGSTRCGSPRYSRRPCSIGASGQPIAVASASAASALAALWRPRMRSASAGIRRCRWISLGCGVLALASASRRLRSARTSQAMPFSTHEAEVARALRRAERRSVTTRRGAIRGGRPLPRRPPARRRHQRHRPPASSRLSTIERALAEDARLGRGVGRHGAVPVEVVLRQVEHRGGVGLEALRRRRAGSSTARAPRPRAGVGSVSAGPASSASASVSSMRRADVAGDRDAPAGALDQLRGQRGRRRLAVGAGDGEHLAARSRARLRRSASASREQVELAVAPARRPCAAAASSGGDARRRAARGPGSSARGRRRRASSASSGAADSRVAAGTCSRSAAACGGSARESQTRTCGAVARAPARHRQAESPRPRTSTWWSLRCSHVSPQLQAGQADQAQQHRDDPEAHHDLRLRPAGLLEVVVQRRHLEDAPALAVAASWCT